MNKQDYDLSACKNSKFYRLITKYFPIVEWIQYYRFTYLKNDIVSGLSVGLTVIPQGLAYGAVAGLRPQYGLFAAFWGPFLYFIFGTSKDLTIGPTAILSLLVAHYSLASEIPFDITYSVILSLMAGSIQLILGLFSLGFIANYMSPIVVSGFTSSAAILIGWGQIKYILGLKRIRNNFFLSIYDVCSKLEETNLTDMACGIVSVVVLLTCKLLFWYVSVKRLHLSKSRRIGNKILWFICISANILVVISTTILAFYLKQMEIGTLSLTGNIDKGLPKFELPDFVIMNGTETVKTTSQIFKEIGTGIPIVALIALVEAMAIGKAFARLNGYKIRSSQEFIAIGISNIVGSFFQSLPTTGSFSRTAINSQCMSKSPFSGVITGTVVLLALRFLNPYFVFIPKASLAAIIIVAVMFMTDFKFLYRTWKIKRYDCITWFSTFVLSLGLGVEYGVLIGIGLSFLPIVFIASRPKFQVYENTSHFQGSFLWFPFISKLTAMIDTMEAENRMSITLDLTGVYSADSAIINTLIDIGHDFINRNKILIIVISNPQIISILQKVHADDFGIQCYKSIEDAKVIHSHINERMPLLNVIG